MTDSVYLQNTVFKENLGQLKICSTILFFFLKFSVEESIGEELRIAFKRRLKQFRICTNKEVSSFLIFW